MSTAVASELKLQIHRTYKATPEAIFEAWTNPEFIQQWFGCSHNTFHSCSTDPRPGGAYRIAVEGPSPSNPGVNRIFEVSGTYTIFEPGKLLAFTWNIPGEETLVTVMLTPIDGGTELLLTHERFQTEQSREAHNEGWMLCLNAMDKLFGRL